MTKQEHNPQPGDLRIWHLPQVPMQPFQMDVPDVATAKLVIKTLWAYDLFQYHHRIKPDYANASGLSIYDAELGWIDWENEDGESINDVIDAEDQ